MEKRKFGRHRIAAATDGNTATAILRDDVEADGPHALVQHGHTIPRAVHKSVVFHNRGAATGYLESNFTPTHLCVHCVQFIHLRVVLLILVPVRLRGGTKLDVTCVQKKIKSQGNFW